MRSRVLLDELESLIVTEGFAGLTLAELAQRLHCSLRAFYEIAPNRQELLLVTIDRRMRRLGRHLREELAEHDDPPARLNLVLTLETSTLQTTSAQFREDAQKNVAIADLILAHKRYGASLIHDILVDGMRRGRFRRVDPYAIVEFIDAAVSRLEQPRFADSDDHHWSEYVDELSRFVEAGVLAGR
ncbi:transcriptional regulator, TetR family [Nocardia nova SH22a]|uniref:Transcriptional regulator, TetR family n=1 Tax=Nocardia nova SH22a TaxID=1415166 RepID=W5TKF4_9NOCA|nr:TetR/AcrR family transcriptional regulator [Nocardia nova]AHH19845.1 transcriptional regulator, TetR family [Nocardia nova SH22a]